jgi:uncharacterized protein (DUF1501 family)
MLRLTAQTDARNSRRTFLRVGAAGFVGLSLPDLLRAATSATKAKSLIVMAMEGGPAHQDLWDMKPDAPANVRGEFKPIATTVPNLVFCEHLPLLAKQAHHLAFIRSVHHTIGDHNAGYYYALTGKEPLANGKLIVSPSADNFPPIPSVVAKLRPTGHPLPDLVQTPDMMSNNGFLLPGQHAGFFGAALDPFISGDPSLPNYMIPGLDLPKDLPASRIAARRSLLDTIDHTLGDGAAVDRLEAHYQRAFRLISSPEARRAFDLSQEPQKVRDRYGLDPDNPRRQEARKFGGLPHLGQCLLLARRLIESGVRVVTVCTGARFDQSWDTHRDHFPLLKRSLLPMFDRGFSALLEDLHQRNLLDSTLVVAMGEFGRTPKIGQITSDAGADKGGRDHWPHCYTVMMAGGGIPGGAIYGASDRFAAYPLRNPVTPQDIAATIYKAMGIDPEMTVRDTLDRVQTLSLGTPIRELVG